MATKSYSKNLSTVSYKQFDSRWGSLVTSCGGTMAQQGCAITCGSMVFNTLPNLHLQEMKDEDGADCNYQWATAATLKNKTYSATSGGFDSLKAAMFESIVTDGIPVIVAVPGHFIVVKGFVGTLSLDTGGNPIYSSITTSMFKVNDPGSSSNSTLKNVVDQKGSVSRMATFS